MHELPILKDIVILLSTAILTSIIFQRIKIPTIVGYILGGIVIGPYGIGLIEDKEFVDVMAEIGVVLLLFTIGIEFSISEILRVGRRGLLSALMQVIVTTLVVAGLSMGFNLPLVQSFFFGFIITLSSTAIVLRVYMDKGEMGSLHGRLTLGVLLTQDMAIIPMVLFLEVFGGGDISLIEVGKAFGVAIAATSGIILAAYYLVPRFLHQIVHLKSPEALTMASIFVCLGTAWISSYFGLSLALGAFIAGIVLSESEYSHQVTASVLPFRDIFNGVFFLSIGMLIRTDHLLSQFMPVLILTSLVILLKLTLVTAIIFIMRYPLRIAFVIGMSLAQIGEFSFVLLKLGKEQGFIDQVMYQPLLSSIVLSMILTPLLIRYSAPLAQKLPNIMPRKGEDLAEINERSSSAINHVIIAGYGLMGELLATVLKKTGISYIILDINNDNVKRAKKEGHIAYYGDTSYQEVLRSVGITAAKLMVFAISDPVGTRRGIKIAREINPKLHIIVRTKYMGELSDLIELGADQVIPEEFETSVEIFSRVLQEYRVPGNIIENQINMVRLEGYSMLRGVSLPMEKMSRISAMLAASVSESFYIDQESPALNKSIREVNIRDAGGASIIAVVRGDKTRTNPPPSYVIEDKDILILLGSHSEIAIAKQILSGE